MRAARQHLSDTPFVILYSDVLLNLDLSEFSQAHTNTKAAISTLALTSVADPSAYDAVKLRGSRIVQFSEKPAICNDVSLLVFAGYAVFNFLAKKRGQLSLEQNVFPELIKQGRLYACPFEDQWFDVSTPEVYDTVLKQWQK